MRKQEGNRLRERGGGKKYYCRDSNGNIHWGRTLEEALAKAIAANRGEMLKRMS